MKKTFYSVLLGAIILFSANSVAAVAPTITFNDNGVTGTKGKWGITLFDDTNYNADGNVFSKRSATTVTSPTYPQCINLSDVKDKDGSSWSTRVSSVEVTSGLAVILYNMDNCTGFERTLVGSDSNLVDDSIGSTGSNWNDSSKSMKIIQGSTFPGKAILYDNTNYGGISLIVSGDTALDSLWNDRSSSIIVIPGNTIVLYENAGYGGYSMIVTSDKANTQVTANQDWVSSIKVNPSSNPGSGNPGSGSGTNTGGDIQINNPITADSFEEIVSNIINFLFTISFVVAPLMIVWAGGLYVTSAGDQKKVETAKNVILYTVAGMIILLFSKGFVAIVNQLLK